MKSIGIMQPYLFPYIGYWQLINTVDKFIIYDDVSFIKQGFINKNNILCGIKKQSFTLELIGASQNKLINEIKVGNNCKKILKTVRQNYIKAPFFNTVFLVIENILKQDEKSLAKFIGFSLLEISNYLEIDTKFIYSSDIEKNNTLRAQDKVIEISKILNTSIYINAIGGKELYSKDDFKKEDIHLNFLKTELIEYKQFNGEFIPYLSIIDILMFNSVNKIKNMLTRYKLV